MEFIQAKTLVQSVQHGSQWFGVDYNMNLYRGCCHGCIYCDSRSECYHVDHFDTVRIKQDTGMMLRNELARKRRKGVVGIGAMSDTYNPFEKQYEVTREALQILAQFHFGVCIETKSDLIVRDIDVLKEIQAFAPVITKLTVTTADDHLAKQIEPYAPSSSKRLMAIRKMRDAGIYAGVLMMPILPFINDTPANIKAVVKAAYDAHASFIYPSFGVTLRANQRDYYYEKLDALYPGLRKQYERTYGEKYMCDSPQAKLLASVFRQECNRYGIPYKMRDIIAGYKQSYEQERQIDQLSLF